MVIDQRNAGASGTAGTYTVDRWAYQASQASKATWQQNAGSVTPPTGFKNYLGITSSSAYSVVSSDYFFLSQTIEGYNIADLGWGTADAKTVTLSFWVRSSLTGTFGGAIRAGGFDYSYPFSYTISSANTWEQKSITIAGPTSGTWGSTNGNGLQLDIGLGAGSTYSGTAGSWTSSNLVSATGATSVVGTSGATFYITGVQLEVGSSATGFEYRQYGQELALCQRYCFQMNSGQSGSNNVKFGLGTNAGTTESWAVIHFPVQLRTYPTLTVTSTASNYGVFQNGDIACNAVPFINVNSSPNVGQVIFTVASGLSANGCSMIQTNGNNTAYLRFNAEL
jgi:hypothetical protein